MQRARGVRNGLMIALLALHPLRIKNFATLRIGQSIKKIGDCWWLIIEFKQTKTRRRDERRVPEFMTEIIDRYVEQCRPILLRENTQELALAIRNQRCPIHHQKYGYADLENHRTNIGRRRFPAFIPNGSGNYRCRLRHINALSRKRRVGASRRTHHRRALQPCAQPPRVRNSFRNNRSVQNKRLSPKEQLTFNQ